MEGGTTYPSPRAVRWLLSSVCEHARRRSMIGTSYVRNVAVVTLLVTGAFGLRAQGGAALAGVVPILT